MEYKPMEKRYLLILTLLLGLVPLGTFRSGAQQDATRLRVVVNLVQLNVAVTDKKGNYVTGLHPQDFAITEDGMPENIATFEEGNGPTTRLRSEEHTSELQSLTNLVCRLLLEKKK